MEKFLRTEKGLDLLAIVVILIAIQIFFYRIVIFDENFFWRDILSHSFPAKKILIDSINAGYFPLWNPFVSIGMPYLADLSNQPLYIFNLLFLILPASKAINLTIVLHFFLAGSFTYFFVKDLLNNRQIAVFSSITFVLSGYSVSLTSNLEYLVGIVWIPAIFWAYYKAIKTGKTLYILLLGIFFALLIYGGEPMAYYYIAPILLLHALFKYKENKILPKALVIISAGLIVSLIVAAAQLLPSFELASLSIRAGGLDFKEATIWSFSPARILEFYLPFFYGFNLPYPLYWGVFLQKISFSVPWSEGIYFGAIGFILTLSSLFYRRNNERYFWITVLIICLILAFGRYSPVYKILFDNMPMFSSFRYPEKLIIFVTFCSSILAGFTLKDILEYKPQFRKQTWYFIIALIIVTVAVASIDFASTLPLKYMALSGEVDADFVNSNFRFTIIYFAVSILIFALIYLFFTRNPDKLKYFIPLLILLTCIDLFVINTRVYVSSKIDFYNQPTELSEYFKEEWKEVYPPRLFASPYLARFVPGERIQDVKKELLDNFYAIMNLYWLKNLIPNRSILYNIAMFQTVTSLLMKNVNDVSEDYFLKKKTKFLRNLNINYLLASPFDVDEYKNYGEIKITNLYNVVIKPEDTVPRAFIVYNALYFKTGKDVANQFMNEYFDIRSVILLQGKPAEEYLIPDTASTADITVFEHNKVEVVTQSKTPGYLKLLEAYYPGWRVFIDGREVNILVADHVYRAVKIPAGKHKVVFLYNPSIVTAGFLISLSGLIFFIFLTFRYKEIFKVS